jgi:RNA polymerase sigma factor (sigma-70 family)
MASEPQANDHRVADADADSDDADSDDADLDDLALPGVTATLRRLAADGLGPAMGLAGDWRRRSAIDRVARLGPEELAHRLDDVFRRQSASLVAYAQRILGNRDDAEDVVNEAFARVLRADPDLVAPEALAGYLRAVVRNEALDRGTANTRDRVARRPSTAPPPDGTGAPVDLDAVLTAAERPLEDRVCDDLTLAVALQMLSARQRQCFALRFVDGLSVSEVAARLSISDGNVKRICHDVRARIAAALVAA